MPQESKLIICNTYYQLIMALQLSCTLFKEDYVSVVISDQSRNAKEISETLRSLNVFENVYYVENKILCAKKDNVKDKITDLANMILGTKKYLDITNSYYDEIVYYNQDIFTYIIFAELVKKNSDLKCSRYEEGILSYNNKFVMYKKLVLANKVRKIIGKANLAEKTMYFYCCYPSLYRGELKAKQVPLVNDNKMIGRILAKLFDLDEDKLIYKEKYIFFASVFDFEGGEPVGEFDVVEKVSELVGKENLLVKVHPRDVRNVYLGQGFHVDSNSAIPWEAIQLNKQFNDKVFLTVNSGSVLSVNMMIENGPKALFLYPLCKLEGNLVAQENVKNIEGLLSDSSFMCELQRVNRVEVLEDILKY